MEITEKKSILLEEVTDVICDCCGKSCKVFEAQLKINSQQFYKPEQKPEFEFMKLEVRWGYFSNKDGEKWSAQICEKCVDEKFSFVKFKKESYNILGD